MVSHELITIAEAAELIAGGEILLIAGDESLLKTLPRGNWIGGTIPYFMAAHGGTSTKEQLFVTRLGSWVKGISIRSYDTKSIASVYTHTPENGITFLIIPAFSEIHSTFALEAPAYAEFGNRPLAGWISGVHVDEIGTAVPKTIHGHDQSLSETEAVALHVTLTPDREARISIINIFEQGDGDEISFTQGGFSCTTVLINGIERNFYDYIKEENLDTQLPLVADYSGALINISFQRVDEENKTVYFYAPVFPDVVYRHARPVDDYINSFTSHLKDVPDAAIAFSCNCILNYLYSGLEGRSTGPFTGPITFGEIAYMLLNQTLVYAHIDMKE